MHRADPPARLEDGYVEADDHGFHTLWPKLPGEARQLVMGVKRIPQPENKLGELPLDGSDCGVDGVATLRDSASGST